MATFALVVLASASGCGPSAGGGTSGSFTAAPTSSASYQTPVGAIATELSSGSAFSDPDEAQRLVGFPILRVDQARFPVLSQKGLTETFPEIGLPRARQILAVPGHETTLEFTQEPETYPAGQFPGGTTDAQLGPFGGQLWQWHGQICFRFPSGAELSNSKIIALACTPGGYSVDDVRLFVEALSFGTASPSP
jgi:hypothetical protein